MVKLRVLRMPCRAAGVLALCLLVSAAAATGGGDVWVISDPHVVAEGKPLVCRSKAGAAGSYGAVPCDAPVKVVDSVLDFMKQRQASPQAILVLGDAARHKAPDAGAVASNIGLSVQHVRRVFPDTRVIAVVGNNDVYPHYRAACGGMQDQLKQVAEAYAPMVPAAQLATFLQSGYYTTRIGSALDVIVFNSGFFSQKRQAVTQEGSKDDCQQLSMLERDLTAARAAKQSVWLMSHIPPGINGAMTSQLWDSASTTAYLALVSKYSDVITAQMFGHTHMSALLALPGSAGGVLTAPGVSSYSYSFPGVRLVTHDPAGNLVDVHDYYLDIIAANKGHVQWKESMSFRSMYGVSPTPQGISTAARAIAASADLTQRYALQRRSMYSHVDDDLRTVACSVSSLTIDDLKHCRKQRAS